MYFHLDRTPACRWRGDSPNLLSCLSTTVLTLTFEESLCGSQLLNHIVEDTSRVKHRLHRVFRDLFKVVRGRWWSEESVPVKRNDSKYRCSALTLSPIVVTLLVFQSYCAPPPVFHLSASQWSISIFVGQDLRIQAAFWLDAKTAVLEKEPCETQITPCSRKPQR